MKSIFPTKGVPAVEVTHITKHGLWLVTRDTELFISLHECPQFRDASLSNILYVEQPTAGMLHWPHLGIILPIGSVRRFPLVSSKSRLTTRSRRRAKTGSTAQSKTDRRSTPACTQG